MSWSEYFFKDPVKNREEHQGLLADGQTFKEFEGFWDSRVGQIIKDLLGLLPKANGIFTPGYLGFTFLVLRQPNAIDLLVKSKFSLFAPLGLGEAGECAKAIQKIYDTDNPQDKFWAVLNAIRPVPAIVTITGSTIELCSENFAKYTKEFFLEHNPYFFIATLVLTGVMSMKRIVDLVYQQINNSNGPTPRIRNTPDYIKLAWTMFNLVLATASCFVGVTSLAQAIAKAENLPGFDNMFADFGAPAIGFGVLAVSRAMQELTLNLPKYMKDVHQGKFLEITDTEAAAFGDEEAPINAITNLAS